MVACDREPQASLVVSGELRDLSRVSAWVLGWAEHQRLPETVAQHLDLCSTEVVTNIITYAFSDDDAKPILLRLGWQGEVVSLEVEDEGRQFDPLQVAKPAPASNLQDARIGGWGLSIVRRFSDAQRYHRQDGRNRLTLLFRPTALPP